MSLTDEDIIQLKQWGTNIVRLGVIWEAVEKKPGIYDFEYLDEIESIVKRLHAQGIYTIIDSHLDLFSRALCGEGGPTFYFPKWDTLNHACPWSLTGLICQAFGQCKPFSSYEVPLGLDGYPI